LIHRRCKTAAVWGNTVWGGRHDGRQVALAWDFIEVMPGVVCMTDPNHIITNIRFVDANDCYEEPLQAIISANRLAHRAHWHAAALRMLRQSTAKPRAVRGIAGALRPRPPMELRTAA
jgi:hypothetical protein